MNALTHTTTKPPTISGAADPYAAYGLTGSRDGVALKFNKSGEWIAALTEGATVIPAGREFVALMEDLACAWTKWIDSKPVDRRVTLVASGVAPPLRDTLGDTDQALWETDDEGKLRDPWQTSHELPLLDQESGEQFVFVTSSVGGKGALSKLALAFSRGRGSHPNSNPIVALGAGGYQHKIKSRGFIHVPTLRIAGWAPRAGEIAKVSAAEAMNDAIPF